MRESRACDAGEGNMNQPLEKPEGKKEIMGVREAIILEIGAYIRSNHTLFTHRKLTAKEIIQTPEYKQFISHFPILKEMLE